jgi:glycosyltransferase involved in cell wall biosynthesis
VIALESAAAVAAGVPEAVSSGTTLLPASRGHAGVAVTNGIGRPIRLLVFTSLYPNSAQPRHGIFVEERLRKLIASGVVTATVVAPVPWFPFRHSWFGTYAVFARVPREEVRHGIRILHPRYPVIPKVGMNVAPDLMYRAVLGTVRRLCDAEAFDLIDAHYLYPDGVAASRLGAAVDKPVVITARGSDANVIAQRRVPGRQIKRAARRAAGIVAVSNALKHALEALGVVPNQVTVLRNGVDLERFQPRDRAGIRAKLGVSGPVWLSVGHLVELKGVHIAIAALPLVRGVRLLVVGDGPDKVSLTQAAERLEVAGRVQFLGAIDHDALCDYYNAADALVLASSREGMPNVVLESLACGTPVLATQVGGIPELITSPEAGELLRERAPEALARAWGALSARRVDRHRTREFAERLGWTPVVDAQCELYSKVLATHGRVSGQTVAP